MGIKNIETAFPDSDPQLTFFVVAPDYAWFQSWCQDNQINSHDKRHAIFVNDMKVVQGHRLTTEKQIIDLGPFDYTRYELVLALKSRVV